jgi:ABC-type transporter Mla MlaB component
LVAPRESPTRLKRALLLVVSPPIARADIGGICDRVRISMERSDAGLVVCDLRNVIDPDAVAVDALARLQLTAKRVGRRFCLVEACGELQELLALMGLRDVVPLDAGLSREPRGQAEKREEARSIEEEGDPRDPST